MFRAIFTTSIARTTPAQKPRGRNKIIFFPAAVEGVDGIASIITTRLQWAGPAFKLTIVNYGPAGLTLGWNRLTLFGIRDSEIDTRNSLAGSQLENSCIFSANSRRIVLNAMRRIFRWTVSV